MITIFVFILFLAFAIALALFWWFLTEALPLLFLAWLVFFICRFILACRKHSEDNASDDGSR